MSDDKIQEVTETPAVEQVADGADVTVHNRNEKKARKMIEKLGLKKLPNVARVTMKRSNGVTFIIENPDCYRSPNGSVVVFGEARVDQQDFARQLQALAAQGGQPEGAAPEGAASKDPQAIQADLEAAVKDINLNKEEEEVADADVDVSGLEESDIQIVMDQAGASKAKAVAALRKNKGDVVNTIMELTS